MLHQQPNLQIVPKDALFADLYETLDDLHTAVTEGQIHSVTALSKREILAWLKDMAYTIAETINEIEAGDSATSLPHEPTLRVLKKGAVTFDQEVSVAHKRQYGETGSPL